MDKRTVLFIGNHLVQSGQNKSVGEELAARLEQDGYSTLLVSRKLNRSARLVDMLWTILKQHKSYDLAEVDVFSGPAFAWAFLSARLLKLLIKPFILTLHGGNLPRYALAHPGRVKALLSWAKVVVSPSAYLKQNLAHYRADIQIIPNGLEIDRYSFRFEGTPKPKLVWLRAFHQFYNPSLAPRVVSLLMDQGIEAQLLMVGPDKGDGSLQEMLSNAQSLGVADRIDIIRGVSKEQVPEMLTRGDIFLNTTNYDNTPVSLIEAMASGCCVVTTDVGGIPYLLEDGVDALLVPPDDPQAMAAAVVRILTEPGLAEKLSTNARKKAEQFDWQIILPMWEKILEEGI